jgi:hypothetical protein
VGPREQAAVNTHIHSDWLLRRMRRVESLLWNEKAEKSQHAKYADYDPEDAPLISWYCAEDHFLRIQRRLTALDRAYHRALADLERLQAKRLASPDAIPDEPAAPEIGFVPSPATNTTPAPISTPLAIRERTSMTSRPSELDSRFRHEAPLLPAVAQINCAASPHLDV